MEWLYHVEPVDFANASTEEIRKQLNGLGAARKWEAFVAIPVGGRGAQAVIFKKPNSK